MVKPGTAIEHLPRPWLLAALTELPVPVLLGQPATTVAQRGEESAANRPIELAAVRARRRAAQRDWPSDQTSTPMASRRWA